LGETRHWASWLSALSSLALVEKPKRRPAPFHSFAEYRDHLFSQVRDLCANAQAPERKHRFAPITTISASRGRGAAPARPPENTGVTASAADADRKRRRVIVMSWFPGPEGSENS